MKKRRKLERLRELALQELARPRARKLGVVEPDGIRPVVDDGAQEAQLPSAQVLPFKKRGES